MHFPEVSAPSEDRARAELELQSGSFNSKACALSIPALILEKENLGSSQIAELYP